VGFGDVIKHRGIMGAVVFTTIAVRTSEPAEHFKKSCRDQAAVGGQAER